MIPQGKGRATTTVLFPGSDEIAATLSLSLVTLFRFANTQVRHLVHLRKNGSPGCRFLCCQTEHLPLWFDFLS
ncbi:hypothetical protein C2U30_06420 [Aeromonas sp. ASNIH5]|nr:hypothetical protein C2U30_06420 [Aeromonas sp. ASNIH5]